MKNNFSISGRKQTNVKFVEVEKRLKEKRISNIDDRRTDSNGSLKIFRSKTPVFQLRPFFDQKRLISNFGHFDQKRFVPNFDHFWLKTPFFEYCTFWPKTWLLQSSMKLGSDKIFWSKMTYIEILTRLKFLLITTFFLTSKQKRPYSNFHPKMAKLL